MGFQSDFLHRDALIEAAVNEFDTHGYAQASINRILDAAGMSKGQFYHHFPSKQDLYLALLQLMVERKRAHFADHPVEPGSDMFTGLRHQLEAGSAFARSDPLLHRMARSFMRERGTPIFDTVLRHLTLDDDASLQSLIATGFARGELREDITPRFAARTIALILSRSTELLEADTPEDYARGVEQLVSFLRRGLGR